MKVLDIPKSGKCGDVVFYRVRGRQYWRRHVVPHNPRTAAQRRAREILSVVSKAWNELLTEKERRAWREAGQKVMSRPRLFQSASLTGEMHFAGINSVRLAIGRALLREPPERIMFGPNLVEELTISHDQGRLKLELRVSGPVTEDIMVLGAAPCSAGRRKCRKPAYLGLLPAPVGGMSEITEMYVRRYGEPKSGERVFIRTRQQRDGWEDWDKDVSDVVRVEVGRPSTSGRMGANGGGMLLGLNELPGLHELQRDAVAGWRGQWRNQPCPREMRRSRCLVTGLQFPWNRRCAKGVGGVGRPWAMCALGEGDRNGPWHELWHHS
jgi:hypothetical protein